MCRWPPRSPRTENEAAASGYTSRRCCSSASTRRRLWWRLLADCCAPPWTAARPATAMSCSSHESFEPAQTGDKRTPPASSSAPRSSIVPRRASSRRSGPPSWRRAGPGRTKCLSASARTTTRSSTPSPTSKRSSTPAVYLESYDDKPQASPHQHQNARRARHDTFGLKLCGIGGHARRDGCWHLQPANDELARRYRRAARHARRADTFGFTLCGVGGHTQARDGRTRLCFDAAPRVVWLLALLVHNQRSL
jgi:hypothetical protein